MAIVRARSPFVWLRRALFALGVLALLGVGLLFAAYRFGSAGQVEEAPAVANRQIDEGTVTAGEGFDYTQITENRQVFRLRAAKSRQDRESMAYLEEVRFEIFRPDGETYTVTSDSATVNQRNWDTELHGNVVLTGWEEFELEARALKLEAEGQLLTSVGAVEFRYPPDLVGRASSLRFDQRSDSIHLSDGVHLKSVPEAEVPIRLDCERLVYLRGEGLIRAFEEVYLRHGDQELETYALSLFLDQAPDGSRSLKNLRARWGVRGRLAAVDEPWTERRVEFEGQLLEVAPTADDSTLRRIKLEGGAEQPAVAKIVDATGLARRITAQRLESRAKGGELHLVEGTGTPLLLEEFLDFDQPWPLRQACARALVARFLPGGRLGRIDLKRQVELATDELYLSGGRRAGLDLEAGTIDIDGPSGVEVYSARGVVTAPRFTYSRKRGVLRAGTGVQATLKESGTLERTPMGQGDGPIHIEAQEAVLTQTPAAYTFSGAVRAWRGQNLLLADQLRADEAQGELAASGGVKTVWIPASRGPARQPIEVTADNFAYRTPAEEAPSSEGSTLIYTGQVEVHQEQRTIRCHELAVEMAPDASGNGPRPSGARSGARSGAPERMICSGDVRLLDPAAGREVRGDTAVFQVPEDRLEIFGQRVELRDAADNSLVGRYLVYDLAAGTVRLKSRAPSVEVP